MQPSSDLLCLLPTLFTSRIAILLGILLRIFSVASPLLLLLTLSTKLLLAESPV